MGTSVTEDMKCFHVVGHAKSHKDGVISNKNLEIVRNGAIGHSVSSSFIYYLRRISTFSLQILGWRVWASATIYISNYFRTSDIGVIRLNGFVHITNPPEEAYQSPRILGNTSGA